MSILTVNLFNIFSFGSLTATGKALAQQSIFLYSKFTVIYFHYLNSLSKNPGVNQMRFTKLWPVFLLLIFYMVILANAYAEEYDWSIGGYTGKYYDTEPAGVIKGDAGFLDQYIVAVTASKSVWRSSTLPLSIEMDGMVGYQAGLATLQEIAIAPVARWSSFPWNNFVQTDFRFGPVGVSYTTIVSPLEKGYYGEGSHWLNFLLAELDFSLPEKKSKEVFLRLHHRCSLYDMLNNFGANGEDFLAFGYRLYY